MDKIIYVSLHIFEAVDHSSTIVSIVDYFPGRLCTIGSPPGFQVRSWLDLSNLSSVISSGNMLLLIGSSTGNGGPACCPETLRPVVRGSLHADHTAADAWSQITRF